MHIFPLNLIHIFSPSLKVLTVAFMNYYQKGSQECPSLSNNLFIIPPKHNLQ